MNKELTIDNLDKLSDKAVKAVGSMFPTEAKDGATKLERTEEEKETSQNEIKVRDAMSRIVDAVYWEEGNAPVRNILTAWLMSQREDFHAVYTRYGPQLLGEFLGLPPLVMSRFRNDSIRGKSNKRPGRVKSRVFNSLNELLLIEESSLRAQREHHEKLIQDSTEQLEYLEGISDAITLVLEYAESKGVGTAPSRVYKNRSIPG